MELFYNPDLMTEEEIRKTFVARQGLVDEIVSLVERQPDGAGMQHIVIIAPRGMGKTTVLLMIRLTMKDRSLAKQWQAVKFPEESYGIYDLADFWIEVLNLLAADTDDEELRNRAENLKAEYPNSDDLQEAALALIKDWRRKHKKRLVLMVDNLDMILEQINDERDNARLRDVLMNDGTIMLIGCAVTFFHEARAYDQPLYNFFKIADLRNLKFDQMEELLLRRAEIDHVENFDAKLKANRGRLRVLEYFTGGNPRLVLMLYHVVVRSEISEVQRGLEKLLDEVTPYYKAKVESLPPQLRKILDHIARVSAETNEGLTPKQIAEATRLSVNQVSSQLKRLSDLGYVQTDNLRGRKSYYVLSERLYSIWHQMRFGRQARERMRWLVAFLKLWYDVEEMGTESLKLESRFRELLSSGRTHEARDALEHRRYLADAMPNSTARTITMDGIVRGYLDLKDTDTLKKDILGNISLQNLSAETLEALCASGCITEEELSLAKASAPESEVAQPLTEVAAALNKGITAMNEGRSTEALEIFERALESLPDSHIVWVLQGEAKSMLGRNEEALASYDRALELKPDDLQAWRGRGYVLSDLGRYEEALASYDRALEIEPDEDNAWNNRGRVLGELGRIEESLESIDRAIEINPSDYLSWYNRGVSLSYLDRYEEAVASYDRALEIEPGDYKAWSNRGSALFNIDRYEEAVASYDRALEIKPDAAELWFNKGSALGSLNRDEDALASYDQALNTDESHLGYLRSVAHLMNFRIRAVQGKLDLAKQHWMNALRSATQSDEETWHGMIYQALISVAQAGRSKFVGELIKESKFEVQLFPLARAIDYLVTGDEALIEKLSPEVKGVVQEVINTLRKDNGQGEPRKTKSKARKVKSGSRRRTRKQLS